MHAAAAPPRRAPARSGLAIGYFPTYLLGAMMAAQLAHHIRRDMPDIDAKVAAGDFAPIRAWLGEKVRHGSGAVRRARPSGEGGGAAVGPRGWERGRSARIRATLPTPIHCAHSAVPSPVL